MTTKAFKRTKRLLAIGAVVALIQTLVAAESEEPLRLEILRDSFEREVERELAPLKMKYLTALKSLQQNYTKAGNLEDALAVEKEIARIEGTDSAAKEKQLNEILTSSKFVLKWGPSKDKQISFLTDGSIGIGKNDWENTWKIKDSELHIIKKQGNASWIFSYDNLNRTFKQSATPHELDEQRASLRITKG